MQVCNRCRRDIDNKTSGIVLGHPDVDIDGRPNTGQWEMQDELCKRCFEAFRRLFADFLRSGRKV